MLMLHKVAYEGHHGNQNLCLSLVDWTLKSQKQAEK